MARLPRFILPHHPHHVFQKGNNHERIFGDEEDYLVFLKWLKEAANQYEVRIHAYTLMETQLHILATPSDKEGLASMMQWIGRHYVTYFNRKYDRTGTLWEGRFRTSLIEAVSHFLDCSCFLEWLPVRLGIAKKPDDYRWSSYSHHAGIRQDPLISDHRLYWDLGNTPFAREAAYHALMMEPFSFEEAEALHQALVKGWLIGSDDFRQEIERRLDRKLRLGRRGRPPKNNL